MTSENDDGYIRFDERRGQPTNSGTLVDVKTMTGRTTTRQAGFIDWRGVTYWRVHQHFVRIDSLHHFDKTDAEVLLAVKKFHQDGGLERLKKAQAFIGILIELEGG